ncbi:MBL fold metallo-hydrolase [Isachenkonia alkalipeptolytica]|nr:MBL fold metallo-hydrolase [Isachenkonia alkalipeptolytica]
MDPTSLGSLIWDWITQDGERVPSQKVPMVPLDWAGINSDVDSLTWFGHSNVLLSIDNKKILIDPMFDDMASPVSFIGSRRFTEDIFHVIEDLPQIDAVFITHDHYDHLDYPSILALKDKTEHFFVPLGVDAHLSEWGVEPENITAMNWWDEVEWQGVDIAAVPARHYSSRGLFDQNSTLWSGWVISGEETNIYISGDTSYGQHFQAIGETYGPFDLTLIEGGQYDRRWADSHMFPEEAVQAHIDARGEVMMLMHWGAFSLSLHDWSELIERALVEGEDREVSIIAPQIGETVDLQDLDLSITPWWDF